MRISRFIDPEGIARYGIDQNDGTASILQGSLYDGLQETGRSTSIEKLLAPLEPCNILCIGLNYHDHAREIGFTAPESPVLFMKPTSSLNHPNGKILIPSCCEHGPEVDYEAELAVVIGKTAHNVTEQEALDFVLGYSCANDVSARRWQKHGGGGQWVRSKGFDTFCPLGPVLLTKDEIPDPQNLRVRCLVNGELMQDGSTSDMIFPVARLISELSRDTTLLPGTLILTGTPPGVGVARTPPVFLIDGDKVRVEIDPIGTLANSVTEA